MADIPAPPRHRSSPLPLHQPADCSRAGAGIPHQAARPRCSDSCGGRHCGAWAPRAARPCKPSLRSSSSASCETMRGIKAERKLILTPTALKIVRDSREFSPDRHRALQEAALSPKIHQELWEKFGAELPDTGTLVYFLESERGGFTDRSAKELIAEYRDTLRFSDLTQSDSIQAMDEGQSDMAVAEQPNYDPAPTRAPDPHVLTLAPRERVVFHA